MPTIDPIRMKGLEAFRTGLRTMDADTAGMVADVTRRAGELVVADARRRVPVLTGKARASVDLTPKGTAVNISGGGPRVPYFPWLDYGGRVGRKRSVKRPYRPDGRIIYPALSAQKDEVLRAMEKGLAELVKSGNLKVG